MIGRKALVVCATGTGKRLMAVEYAQYFKKVLFVAHREELIQQAYDDFEKEYPLSVGMIKGPKHELNMHITIGSIQTIWRRLNDIPRSLFDLIIVDECFPAGTRVDEINIEDIKVGDYVSSYNHKFNIIEKKKVLKIYKNKVHDHLVSIKLINGKGITCTLNHPIYTIEFGYVPAIFISLCKLLMLNVTIIYHKDIDGELRYMRKDYHHQWGAIEAFQAIRKNILFKELSVYFKEEHEKANYWNLYRMWQRCRSMDAHREGKILSEWSNLLFSILCKNTSKKRNVFKNDRNEFKKKRHFISENEGEESYDEYGDKTKNGFKVKRKNIFVSWWKWTVNKATIKDSRINWIAGRICNNNLFQFIYGKKSTESLQSRFSMSGCEISNRDRWKYTQIEEMEILGSEKNQCIEFIRVESCQIHKSGSGCKSSEDCKENYVYNIEVEENNNYFANSILVHNCHHYLSRTYCESILHFNCEFLIGLTATPTRLDGLSMSNLFEKIVYEYPIDRAIKEGYLCKIDALRIKTEIDLSSVHTQMGDFKSDELSRSVDIPQRNNLIVDKYTQYAEGKQCIVFGVDIRHAINLMNVFNDRGYSANVIHSKLDKNERSEIIDSFKRGKTTILTNCEILTEGFDYNDIGCLCMARPTKSLSLYMQMIGRGTRLKSESFIQMYEKNQVTILDFVDNVGKHKLINCWNIDAEKPLEDRIFMSDERKNRLLEKKEKFLLEEKERRRALIEKFYKHDKRVDLLALPVVKQKEGDWARLSPTEKQIDYLKAMGIYDPNADYTRGQCSEIISNLPATEAQKAALAKFKYNVLDGCTRGQAQLAFEELNAKGLITRSKNPEEKKREVKPPFKLF
jgi:superfamily II DNA or RNA helicase